MRFKFKNEDFKDQDNRMNESIWIKQAVERANKRLEDHIATLPFVYCKHGDRFHLNTTLMKVVDDKKDATHEALLWDVVELLNKECENHEPNYDDDVATGFSCKHCKIKLKAKWEPQ